MIPAKNSYFIVIVHMHKAENHEEQHQRFHTDEIAFNRII